MPLPKPKPGEGETIGAMPPEHRAKRPSLGGMPLKHRPNGTGVIPAAATAGTSSTGDLPLANLSNPVIGSLRSRRSLPVITGSPSRGAGVKKHASAPRARVPSLPRPRSNTPSPWGSALPGVKKNTSSPRAPPLSRVRGNTPSPRGSSTSSFASLPVNNVETPTSPSPDTHLGDTAACSGSDSGTTHRTMEKSVRGSSGGDVNRRPCLTARAGAGLSGGDVLQRPHLTEKAGEGLSMETARKPRGSVGKMPQKTSAVRGLNGETRERNHAIKSSKLEIQKEYRVEKSGRGMNGETEQKNHALTGLKGETQKGHHVMKSGWGLNGQKLQKNNAVTGLKGKTQKDHQIKKLGTGSGGGMLQKNNRKKKIVQSEDLDADVERRLTEEMMEKIREADHMIQELSELGLGEDISNEELQHYSAQLPCKPPRVDTNIELDDEELNKLNVRHLLYRIKYYKLTQEWLKNEPHNAELEVDEDDCSLYHLENLKFFSFDEDETTLSENHVLDYLEKEGILGHIKSDSTFDWVFQYCSVAGLDDYQRIVLHNYGGCEYVHWDTYRKYFHDYETELEYLDFWNELSQKLKWMEDYIHMSGPSLTWGAILNRGASQAIKIAAGFTKINAYLAHAAYMEYVDSMGIDIYMYRELDGVYFEIWKRVAKLKKSFRAALDEVYKLDKFPLRHNRMKYALESDESLMEKEFHNFTADVADEASDDKARELIADAIIKLEGRPKYYAHYIKRKIDIARAIGVISPGSP